MTHFIDMYNKLVAETLKGNEIDDPNSIFKDRYDHHQLDCLLHPEKHPLVWRLGNCHCSPASQVKCANVCPFDAMIPNSEGGIMIDEKLCVGCCECIDNCKAKKLTASRDILPAMKAVRNNSGLSYALIAPAFLGQFTKDVTPGKLRTALSKIGFDGMVEVSLFADILTLKEALEFNKNITKETDYQLTSCCCPIWIAMIRKIYNSLMPHVPGSVSPMIASGRTIKHLHPNAVTVFIGPCIAKKAEAKEDDLVGAVDYVLTFQEIKDIFDACGINPSEMEDNDKDHSSRAGRIYARSGGVSEAVSLTCERLRHVEPDLSNRFSECYNPISIRTHKAEGIPACKIMVNDLMSGVITANFYEGMGCVGGCVGGPKALIDRFHGHDNVNIYGDSATYTSPIDNPYVIEMLHQLGFDKIEDLLEDSEIFTRKF